SCSASGRYRPRGPGGSGDISLTSGRGARRGPSVVESGGRSGRVSGIPAQASSAARPTGPGRRCLRHRERRCYRRTATLLSADRHLPSGRVRDLGRITIAARRRIPKHVRCLTYDRRVLARATTPRGGAVAAAVLVFALAAVACVGTDGRQLQARATDDAGAVSSTPATSTPMTGPTTAAPSTTAGRGPLGSGSPVTLAFAGDASFEGLEAALAQRPG